jgi:dCTP deaminase
MVLSDKNIHDSIKYGNILIDDFDPMLVGPASLDLRLGNKAMSYSSEQIIDLSIKEQVIDYNQISYTSYVLEPNDFILASTLETIQIDNTICAEVFGKSSLGRFGLQVHSAGFIDPGFCGNITLQLSNRSNVPIVITSGMKICQLVFHKLLDNADVDYSQRETSLYRNSNGVVVGKKNNLT